MQTHILTYTQFTVAVCGVLCTPCMQYIPYSIRCCGQTIQPDMTFNTVQCHNILCVHWAWQWCNHMITELESKVMICNLHTYIWVLLCTDGECLGHHVSWQMHVYPPAAIDPDSHFRRTYVHMSSALHRRGSDLVIMFQVKILKCKDWDRMFECLEQGKWCVIVDHSRPHW